MDNSRAGSPQHSNVLVYPSSFFSAHWPLLPDANNNEPPRSAQTRIELIEAAAWGHFRAALFRHDLEHSAGSWIERQRAYSAWTAAFLHDEG